MIEMKPGRGPSKRFTRTINTKFPVTYWLITLGVRLLVGRLWMTYAGSRRLGRPLSKLNLGAHRTSDTVFVMATGASINRYGEDRWETISARDSIGMNFFMLHDFVPDVYVMENMEEHHRLMLRLKADDYRHVPVILKTQMTNLSPRRLRRRLAKISMNPPEQRERFYFSLDLLAAGRDDKTMRRMYRVLKSLGIFSIKERFLVLSKRRGSITYIINLAVRMGYKKVVLCGVDLNSPEYFYDSRREELESRGFVVPFNYNARGVHLTNDPVRNPITVADVIVAMDEEILAPMGIQLFVGDASSGLHPRFPEYPWPSSDVIDTLGHHDDDHS